MKLGLISKYERDKFFFVSTNWNSSVSVSFLLTLELNNPRGGGVLPIMAFTGRLRMKGVGISRVEVYERVVKSVISIFKRAFH